MRRQPATVRRRHRKVPRKPVRNNARAGYGCCPRASRRS